MADVRLTTDVDANPVAAGLAEVKNHVARMRSDVTRLMAGAITFGGIVAAIKDVTEYGDRVFELGQRFGVSTTAIQEFGNAAEKNGSSLESIAMGFNRLDIAQSKAMGGNQQMIASFAGLGISVEDLKNLSPEQLMLKIGSSSMNAADMVKILGKNGTELRETLSRLATGTEELSGAIDPKHIRALHDADDAWKTFQENRREFFGNAVGWAADLGRFFSGVDVQLREQTNDLKEQIASAQAAVVKLMRTDPGNQVAIEKALHQVEYLQKRLAAIGEIQQNPPEFGGAGSKAGAQDTESLLAGGKGGSGSGESLAERISKIEQETAARHMTDEQNLQELYQKRVVLTNEMLAAEKGSTEQEEITLKLAQANNEYDKLATKIANDKADAQQKIVETREREQEEAEKEVAEGQRKLATLQLIKAGRGEEAQALHAIWVIDDHLADIEKKIAAARTAGDTVLVATLEKLQQELIQESAIADEELKRAQAREAAEKERELNQIGYQERESQINIERIQGQEDQARRDQIELEYQQRIQSALDAANEAREKGNEEIARANEALARQLQLEKEIAQQKEREAQQQKFVNNLSGYSNDELIVGMLGTRTNLNPTEKAAFEAARQRLAARLQELRIRGQADQIVSQANAPRSVSSEISYLQNVAIPQLARLINMNGQSFQTVQYLQEQRDALRQMLTQITQMNQKTPIS